MSGDGQRDDRQLVVADGLDVVLLSEDEVLVRFGTQSQPAELVRDIDLRGTLARMIRRLEAGPQTVGELTAGLEGVMLEDALDTIADLVARGILCDARLSPIEQYLAYAETGASALGDATIAVVGAGSLGRRVAEALREHGVERLEVVAADDVAAVEAAAGVAADLLVLALDRLDVRRSHVVNRVGLRERRAWLHAAVDGARGLIGPLFVPGRTACYNDLDTLRLALLPAPLLERKHRRHLHDRPLPDAVGLPAGVAIVAGYATLAAVQFLLRGTCFAVGRLTTIDLERMRIDGEDVLRLPRCPVCGNLRPATRAPFPIDVALEPSSVEPAS
jgi:bacteriocin biosynthesis cyclodehydratase domain-containing protein